MEVQKVFIQKGNLDNKNIKKRKGGMLNNLGET